MIGASSSGSRAAVIPMVDADGTLVMVQPRVVRVVGPASYALGGFQVDCSAYFSRIIAAAHTRHYLTATPATGGGGYQVAPVESGANVFSSGKFLAYTHQTVRVHTHTYDKTNTPTGGPSGAPTGLGSDNNHTHGNTYTSTASGAASSSSALAEISATTDLSARTFEFLVWGVPV